MEKDTHFTEADRKLLTLLEERQKTTQNTLVEMNRKLDDKYTTKEEHEALKYQVEKIQEVINRITWTVVLTVIVAILGLVINVK